MNPNRRMVCASLSNAVLNRISLGEKAVIDQSNEVLESKVTNNPKSCPHDGPNTYCLIVKGDSMTNSIPGQRSYPEGTIIFVDPDKPVTNGCRVIAKLPDCEGLTFKEYREDGGKRYLMPLNRSYDKFEITDETRFCGVVILAGWLE